MYNVGFIKVPLVCDGALALLKTFQQLSETCTTQRCTVAWSTLRPRSLSSLRDHEGWDRWRGTSVLTAILL